MGKNTIADIDLIMPVHNNYKLTKQAIESIRKSTSMSYRIILVDNGSTDSTPYFQTYKDVLYIKNKTNKTFANSVNQGLKESVTSPYVGILNNDIKVNTDCFETLIKHLTHDIYLIGPLQAHGLNENKSITSLQELKTNNRYKHLISGLDPVKKEWSLKATNKYLKRIYYGQSQALVKCMPFFCVVMKRRIYHRIGFLHPAFINGGEDEDYCRRIEKVRGRFSVALDVCVRHYTHSTIAKLPIKWDFSIFTKWNMELLYRRHPAFYLNQGYKPQPEMTQPDTSILL